MANQDKVRSAAIIPAYNEEFNIAKVLDVLMKSDFLDEVIVVSDGSTDNTVQVAELSGATVLSINQNIGKGAAMRHGAESTNAEVVLFADADLTGLTTKHVEELLKPVMAGDLVMNVGIRDKGFLITWLTRHAPLISGERAINRKVFLSVPLRYTKGYRVETALNFYCRSRRHRYGSVILPGLKIVRKYKKVRWSMAFEQYLKMSFQVIFGMLSIRVAYILGKF